MRNVIECTNLGKRYPRVTHARRSATSAGAAEVDEVWALRAVDLDIRAATSVGILGRNGAGKSTLLRLLAGVGRPDEGHVAVTGRVSALLDLGGEFSPDLSGRDNARLAGLVAGLRRRAVDEMLDEVVAFADLEDSIDSPLRTYSSGMRSRLAFAVATQVMPEILLVDEVLAVGDLEFRGRCLARLNRFRDAGVAIVVVSHEPALLRQLCEESVWLDGGRLLAHGQTGSVLDQYSAALGERTLAQTPDDLDDGRTEHGVPLRARSNRFGTQQATIRALRMGGDSGGPVRSIASGAPLSLEIEIAAEPKLGPLHVAVVLRRRDGLACVETGFLVAPEARPHGVAACSLAIDRVDLAPGEYSFDAGIWSSDWQVTHDLHAGAYDLLVVADVQPDAVLAPPMWWSIAALDAGHR